MAALPLKTWTREEYRRLAEAGIIASDEKLELLDGQIVHKMTHNPPHAVALTLCQQWLATIIRSGRHLRIQLPIGLSELSEPEPDLVVVTGTPQLYSRAHPIPSQIELVVEVSDASLERDRRFKAPLYSAAGIKELWILDVSSRKLEMHREPAAAGFHIMTILAESESAIPLFNPDSHVQVSALLPAATQV